MATQVPALIQPVDPQVAAQLVIINCDILVDVCGPVQALPCERDGMRHPLSSQSVERTEEQENNML